jgi:hypothetical protein
VDEGEFRFSPRPDDVAQLSDRGSPALVDAEREDGGGCDETEEELYSRGREGERTLFTENEWKDWDTCAACYNPDAACYYTSGGA